MKRAVFLALCISAAVLLAQSAPPQNAFVPNQMKYGPPPPFVPPGAQVAVVSTGGGTPGGCFLFTTG